MKKYIIILLTICLSLSMVACSMNNNVSDSVDTDDIKTKQSFYLNAEKVEICVGESKFCFERSEDVTITLSSSYTLPGTFNSGPMQKPVPRPCMMPTASGVRTMPVTACLPAGSVRNWPRMRRFTMWNTPTISISPAVDVSGDLWGSRSSGMGSKAQRMSLGAVRTVQRTVRTAA